MSRRKPSTIVRSSSMSNDTPDHDGARGWAFSCVWRRSRPGRSPFMDGQTDSSTDSRTDCREIGKARHAKKLYHTPAARPLGTPMIPRVLRRCRNRLVKETPPKIALWKLFPDFCERRAGQ